MTRASVVRIMAAMEAAFYRAERVTFAGLARPERIPGILKAMDLLVHASLREGLARVLPQALLSGCPVISYDADGAREVVRNGETGFLVPAGSAAGWVAVCANVHPRAPKRRRRSRTLRVVQASRGLPAIT